jgi:hypothetical protein
VTGAGETCDGERFGFIPVLRASGHDKWQPMRRDCSVQKSDHKSGRQQRYENDVVHVSACSGMIAAWMPRLVPANQSPEELSMRE